MNIENEVNENEQKVLATGSGVLILVKPIDINGESVSSIKYNFDEITAREKQRATLAYKKSGNGMGMQEFDPDYHLYLFAVAVAKANQSIDINDLLRMNARDAIKAGNLVRDFFFLPSAD
jgi:hypothetical protein